ncbi:MAG: hypothetical protein AAGA50_28110 [Pseudomonadota bacterium]
MQRNEKPAVCFDVLIISGARPKLLEQTLISFEENLFRNIELNDCYINIDPFEGGSEDVEACETICKNFFTKVIANKPETPHFTKAVRWLWSAPKTKWCLHMEDDWLLRRPIELNEILGAMKRDVTQLSFMTKEKFWKYRSNFHYKPNRRKLFGIDLGKGLDKSRPIFSTSPCFIETNFAKQCASLMTDKLDPEKQLNKINAPLSEYTSQFRNHFIGSRTDHVAIDIGREHRAELGISKEVIDGQSYWRSDVEQAKKHQNST